MLCASTVMPTSRGRHRVCRTQTASWYGRYFDGKRTASGERFDHRGMTAASLSLPIGSMVSVTNPRSGRSVVVRINDRGPFVHHRQIDLADEPARRIGLKHNGVERVTVVVLREGSAD
ncbi:MAG TPA: septal ring lytic transglycosylase RlpA family protein [Candidatus Binatus sp.]|nr:septal ring lytic transglycosylase RlpA family protein [Candidatus Binatus sp.]